MQPELKVVPDVNYVGNLLSPEMENDILTNRYDTKIILRKIKQKLEQRKPTIYVYMSPGDIPPKVWISTLIKAFRNTEFNIIVTMAPLKTFTDKIPESENVIFLKSVQSKYVIDNSDIIITHGGANTVTSSLMSGKPMMIFPDMYAERDYNGRAVEKLGAGINFRTEKFTPTDLLDNARKIMSDKKFTSNAKKIGNEMKKLGGSSRTLELIENLQ
jgi:UDP:flavonoid glycosyltransferase YjiC (YdhE family)